MMLSAALSLSLGAVVAHADAAGAGFAPVRPSAAQAIVSGTVVSVDARAGTFTAIASVRAPGSDDRGDAPRAVEVTIATTPRTHVTVDGHAAATLADLTGGEAFYAAFAGTAHTGLSALVANPAEAVFAFTPHVQKTYIAGTIVSTDNANDTFVADAYVMPARHRYHGHAPRAHTTTTPATTPVTITTDASTAFRVNGDDSAGGDALACGQNVIVALAGSPTEPITTLTAGPALRVIAWTPATIPSALCAPRVQTPVAPVAASTLYAFVGTVTALSTSADTVTVSVSDSVPSGLVPSGSAPQTFIVGTGTQIFRGGGTSLLAGTLGSDVAIGDVVTGGVMAANGASLSQIETTPLTVLVAFPSSTAASAGTAQVRARALTHAMALLGGSQTGSTTTTHSTPGVSRKHTTAHTDTTTQGRKRGRRSRAHSVHA